MATWPAIPDWEALQVQGGVLGVDREAKVLRGFVMAQAGPFKSEGRGEFDQQSLEAIVGLANARNSGLKSRFAHPTMSDDGLGKFLGRVRNARLDGNKVRGDLHLDPTSFNTPSGNLGGYVLDLAESDPAALSSSLVLKVKKEYRLNSDGTKQIDANGKPLPPLWRPTALHASDIVDTGDAVDAILSIDDLPDAIQRRGCELLDQMFAGQPREVVESRCLAWLSRYLDRRYGELEHEPWKPATVHRKRKLKPKGVDFSK